MITRYTYGGKHLLPERRCRTSRKLFLLCGGPHYVFFELRICVFFRLGGGHSVVEGFEQEARLWYFVDYYHPARPFATSSRRPQQNTETVLYQATSAITLTIKGDPSFTLHPSVSRLSLHLKMCLLWWNARLSLGLPSLFAAMQCCS